MRPPRRSVTLPTQKRSSGGAGRLVAAGPALFAAVSVALGAYLVVDGAAGAEAADPMFTRRPVGGVAVASAG